VLVEQVVLVVINPMLDVQVGEEVEEHLLDNYFLLNLYQIR